MDFIMVRIQILFASPAGTKWTSENKIVCLAVCQIVLFLSSAANFDKQISRHTSRFMYQVKEKYFGLSYFEIYSLTSEPQVAGDFVVQHEYLYLLSSTKNPH